MDLLNKGLPIYMGRFGIFNFGAKRMTDAPNSELMEQIADLRERLARAELASETANSKLLESELLDRVQKKMIDWAKAKFWWAIVLGGLILGTTGYGLLQSAVSGAKDAALRAEIAAENGEKAISASVENGQKAVERVDSAMDAAVMRTNKAIGTLNSDFERISKKLGEMQPTVNSLGAQLAQSQVGHSELEKRIAAAQSTAGKLDANAHEISMRFAQIEEMHENLKTTLASMETRANESSFLVNYLLKRLADATTESAKQSAIITLGLLGSEAQSAFPSLIQIWKQHDNLDYQTEQELTLALLRIDPHEMQLAMNQQLADPGAVRRSVLRFDGFLGPISAEGVEVLRKLIENDGAQSWYAIGFMRQKVSFENDSSRRKMLELLIEGVRSEERPIDKTYRPICEEALLANFDASDIESEVTRIKSLVPTQEGELRIASEQLVERLNSLLDELRRRAKDLRNGPDADR